MGLLWFIIHLSSSPVRETDNSPLFAVQVRFAGAIDVRFQRRTALLRQRPLEMSHISRFLADACDL